MIHLLYISNRRAGISSRDTFTAEVPRAIERDEAFEGWEQNLTGTLLFKIEAAILKIESEGVVTSAKDLGDGLYEKKWVSGLRLYFAIVELSGRKTLLLLGSGKGKQQVRAINDSRKNLGNYKVIRENIAKRD